MMPYNRGQQFGGTVASYGLGIASSANETFLVHAVVLSIGLLWILLRIITAQNIPPALLTFHPHIHPKLHTVNIIAQF